MNLLQELLAMDYEDRSMEVSISKYEKEHEVFRKVFTTLILAIT